MKHLTPFHAPLDGQREDKYAVSFRLFWIAPLGFIASTNHPRVESTNAAELNQTISNNSFLSTASHGHF